MISIFDELSGKINRAVSRGARDGARRDLGLVLFSERDALRELWRAAERCASGRVADADAGRGAASLVELLAAVDRLRPLFGERAG